MMNRPAVTQTNPGGDEPRGSNGFGYDPLFYIPEAGKTAAELPPERKNAISHRGRALATMLEELDRMNL